MKVKQIGNGGAFNYDKTNSSFLIQVKEDDILLFDCGYNVFSKLRKLGDDTIGKISGVFISHMDDDHIGSLKTFLYYRFFVLGKSTYVLCGSEVYPMLDAYLDDVNKKFDNGHFIDCKICYLSTDYPFRGTTYIKGEHHTPTYGIKILDYKTNECLIISGDTKATMSFRRQLNSVKDLKTVIFHDYSDWDNEPQQVHACKEDFELMYNGYLDKITKYHNNAKFNEDWIDLSLL